MSKEFFSKLIKSLSNKNKKVQVQEQQQKTECSLKNIVDTQIIVPIENSKRRPRRGD